MSRRVEFSLEGKKCASCEIVVEREIQKISGVIRVRASATSNRVTVETDGTEVTEQMCAAVLAPHGYSLRVISSSDGIDWTRVVVTFGLVMATWMVLTNTGILNYAPADATGKGLLAVLGVGFLASFSSCTAVVSGLLLAMSSRAAQGAGSFAQKIRPHLSFNIGRLIGFVGFGALVGVVGNIIELSSRAHAILVLAVAVLMIGIGVDLLKVLPAHLSIRAPKWVSHRIHAISESKHPVAPAILGALTFFSSVWIYAIDPAVCALDGFSGASRFDSRRLCAWDVARAFGNRRPDVQYSRRCA